MDALSTSLEGDGKLPKFRGTFFLGDSTFTVYEEMAKQLEKVGWTRVHSQTLCDLLLGDRFRISYGSLRCELMASSSYFHGVRWINYFEGSQNLTLKANMAPLLRDSDSTSADWMPESYVLGGNQVIKKDERMHFIEAAEQNPQAVWIVKPSSGAKGKDIEMVKGPKDVKALVERLKPLSKAAFVAQRYIERPLLLSLGRKFDVRVWVMLQSPFTISVFSQGSCRTASTPFSMEDIANTHAHLTNHCLQEGAEHFGEYEEGNELWFYQLQSYLQTLGHSHGILEEKVLPQISNIIVRSLLVLKETIQVSEHSPYRSFQLFGYDVIIDEDFNVKLLEINGSPGIAVRYLTVAVNKMMQQLGCLGLEHASKAPKMSRTWNIREETFTLLWEEGDPVPQGLRRGSTASASLSDINYVCL